MCGQPMGTPLRQHGMFTAVWLVPTGLSTCCQMVTSPHHGHVCVSVVLLLTACCATTQVDSEDNVLAVVIDYVTQKELVHDDAVTQLFGVVRAPQLSRFWLLALTCRKDEYGLSVYPWCEDLAGLLSLRLSSPSREAGALEASELQRLFPRCPDSWLKGPRVFKPLGSIKTQYTTCVVLLRDYCGHCLAHAMAVPGYHKSNFAATGVSCFISGLRFSATLEVSVDTDAMSGSLGLSVHACNAPRGMFFQFTCQVTAAGVTRTASSGLVRARDEGQCGWPDFFELGPMAGGSDRTAWQDKGLPLSGDIPIELTVWDVRLEAHTAAE